MKKLVSLLLALLMVLSLTTAAIVSVSAASTKIYFEIPQTDETKWGAASVKNAYYCYIWNPVTGEALNDWQSKKNGQCTIESDYLVSYDPDEKAKSKMDDGVTYGLIFVNKKNTQTFDAYFDRTCLGDTVYVDTKTEFINPVDSTKKGNPVYFKNSTSGGPARGITNLGVVQGTAYVNGQTDVDLFRSFMTYNEKIKKSNYQNALELSDYKTCQSLIEYVYSQLQNVTYEDLKPYLPEEFVIPEEPTEPPTPAPTDPPTQPATPAPTELPTNPEPTEKPTEPIAGTSINVGGKNCPVTVGDEVTYTYYLNVQGLLENIEGRIYFDPAKLQFIPDFTYDEDAEENVLDTDKMFPQLSKAGGLVFNYPGMTAGGSIDENEIRFNSSVLNGVAFKKDDAVLVRLRFKVIADGESDINMLIANASYKGGDPVVRDGRVVIENFYYLETLDTSIQPTNPEPTEGPKPTEVVPEPTEGPKPTEAPNPTEGPKPTEAPAPTEESKPTEAFKPTEAPAQNPTKSPSVKPTTSVASSNQKPMDANSKTNTTSTTNTVVKTGTTQFIVVFLVVLAMSAGVIVFARKKNDDE